MEEKKNNTVPAGMSLNQRWGKIRIYHNTILALGEPKYVRFLFNVQAKKLAVQSQNKKQAENFKVPVYKVDDWDFRISSMNLINMIWKICGWDQDKSYRLSGELFENHNLVEFDLSKAVIIADEEM